MSLLNTHKVELWALPHPANTQEIGWWSWRRQNSWSPDSSNLLTFNFCCDKILDKSDFEKKRSLFRRRIWEDRVRHSGMMRRSRGSWSQCVPQSGSGERGTLVLGCLPPFPLFIRARPRSMEWYHPHSEWVIPHQLNLSENVLTDNPRVASSRWFQNQPSWP